MFARQPKCESMAQGVRARGQDGVTVSFPIQITYRSVEISPGADAWIRNRVEKLATFHEKIIRCRVAVELAHRHLRQGNRYQVRVLLSVPGGRLATRSLSAPIDPEKLLEAGKKLKKQEIGMPQKELRRSVTEALRSAARRLQDQVRRRRRQVKQHQTPVARVADILPIRGFGFLEAEDGRRIYFHRNSVLCDAFRRLRRGMLVTFAEERGERGPQASTVRLASRPRKPRRPAIAA
jgi:cold shock CspA family protein/ribosome-associated translation inhibitor RaiA